MSQVLETLQTRSLLVVLRRNYVQLIEQLCQEFGHDPKKEVALCAAKLMDYFRHWQAWKRKTHRTDWVYQPLKAIYDDLMQEHSLHTIRAATQLLHEIGLVHRRKNPGNGQCRTLHYRFNREFVQQQLSERRNVQTESAKFTAEKSYTQLPNSAIAFLNNSPLSSEEEETPSNPPDPSSDASPPSNQSALEDDAGSDGDTISPTDSCNSNAVLHELLTLAQRAIAHAIPLQLQQQFLKWAATQNPADVRDQLIAIKQYGGKAQLRQPLNVLRSLINGKRWELEGGDRPSQPKKFQVLELPPPPVDQQAPSPVRSILDRITRISQVNYDAIPAPNPL